MGHLINPTSHRIGASKCWNSLMTGDSRFRFTYMTLMKSDWDIYFFFKRFFDLKLMVQSGYIFSHVKLIHERRKLFCIVYFYDGGSLERSDNMKHIFRAEEFQLFGLKSMFFISLYSFLRLYQWNTSYFKIVRNFKFDFLFNYFTRKREALLLSISFRASLNLSLKKRLANHLDFAMVECVHVASFDHFGCYLAFSKLDYSCLSFFEKLFLLDYGFYTLGIFLNFYFNSDFVNEKFFFDHLYLFKKYKKLSFFFKIFFNKYVSNLFIKLRFLLFRKIKLVIRMLRFNFRYLSYDRFFFYYLADNFFFFYRTRARVINAMKHTFSHMPQKIFLNSVKIILKKMEVSELNATIVSKYIATRLRQRFQLREILMPLLRHLTYNKYVRGFRITCAGRFTKKEIALYDLHTFSSVPFSGVTAQFDYSLSEVVLKYSICGIKVWLHKFFLPQRKHDAHVVGMHFILAPHITTTYMDNLDFCNQDAKNIKFSSNKLDSTIFKSLRELYTKKFKKEKMIKSKRGLKSLYTRFFGKMGVSFDFFFLDAYGHVRKRRGGLRSRIPHRFLGLRKFKKRRKKLFKLL